MTVMRYRLILDMCCSGLPDILMMVIMMAKRFITKGRGAGRKVIPLGDKVKVPAKVKVKVEDIDTSLADVRLKDTDYFISWDPRDRTVSLTEQVGDDVSEPDDDDDCAIREDDSYPYETHDFKEIKRGDYAQVTEEFRKLGGTVSSAIIKLHGREVMVSWDTDDFNGSGLIMLRDMNPDKGSDGMRIFRDIDYPY